MVDINIWSGPDYQGLLKFGMWETPERLEQRYQILLTELIEINPDVIFLQETSPVDHYCRRLARDLRMHEIHQVCIAGIKFFGIGPPLGFKEGNAILARKGLKLTKLDDWKLSGSPGIYSANLSYHVDETVSALLGRISIRGKPVYLVCMHLTAAPRDEQALLDSLRYQRDTGIITNYEFETLLERWNKGIQRREREMNKLLEQIDRLPSGIPLIVGGDFNATPQSAVVQNFISRGNFVDLPLTPDPDAVTWDAVNNTNTHYSQRKTDARGRERDQWYVFNAIAASLPRRLDYIFLNESFAGTDSISSRIIFDDPVDGVFASDHYGIQVDLVISKSLEGVPTLFGYLQTQRFSKSIFPLLYPASRGLGYSASVYLLSPFKMNESFDLTLDNSTGGERFYRFIFSIPDYKLRQRHRYNAALDLKVQYDRNNQNNYFGLGNDSSYSDKETFNRQNTEVSVGLSRSFNSYLVGQIGYRYKWIRMSDFDPEGLLDDYFEADSSTKQYSNLYGNFRYDTRNSFTNPTRGLLLQEEIEPITVFSAQPSEWAGNLKDSYTKYTVNAQLFRVLFYPTTVLALRLLGRHVSDGGKSSEVPLHLMLPLGGAHSLRGSAQDRFLGNTMALCNAEIRYPIYSSLGGVLAWDTGKVWMDLDDISFAQWSGNPVAGLRYTLPDIDMLFRLDLSNFMLRMDIGFGKEKTEFHFGFGQAF